MSNQHSNPPLNVRPDAALKARAEEALQARHRTMTAFVTACLAALDTSPDQFLSTLEEHWPPPPPKGRPRKH